MRQTENRLEMNESFVVFCFLESLDGLREAMQLGVVIGEHRKTREMLNWTRRKQRRHFTTNEFYEDFLGQTISSSNSSCPSNDVVVPTPIIDDLQTFRQALINDNRPDQTTHLETFVREQMAEQLSRKRHFHSNEIQRVKRTRYV